MFHKTLAETIRPSGYYNQKAIKLKALTRWYQGYDFNISNTAPCSSNMPKPTAPRFLNASTARSVISVRKGWSQANQAR